MVFLAQHNIIDRVKNKWRQLGDQLGQSDDLDGYARKAQHDDYECCSKVFQAWINNGGAHYPYSLSWQGLIDVLSAKSVGHNETVVEVLSK